MTLDSRSGPFITPSTARSSCPSGFSLPGTKEKRGLKTATAEEDDDEDADVDADE